MLGARGFLMPKAVEESQDGNFQCPYKTCGKMFSNEKDLLAHIGSDHRDWKYTGGSILRPGVVLEETGRTVNADGYVVDDVTKRPIDTYNVLRRILTNNGIRDKRESIVELFEYEDPRDINALDRILAMADVTKSKRQMVVSLWKHYVDSSTSEEGDEDMDESSETWMGMGSPISTKKKKSINPLTANPDEMVNWGPVEWGKFLMTTQRWAQAQKMQQQILNTVFTQMGFGSDGGGGSGGQGGLPADVRAKLDRLSQLEDEKKFKDVIDPLVKEIRYLRAEKEDAERSGRKTSAIEEIKEFAMTQKLMETIGSKEGADIMRIQMEERLEKLRLNTEKDTKEAQLKAEQLARDNQQLQLKALQVEMGSKIDMLKQAAELATKSKADDLVETMKKAQEVVNTMKTFTGADDAEDKKMKAIAEIISTTANTLRPVLTEVAKNIGGPRPQMGPGAMQQHPSNIPNKVLVKCQTPGCGIDFEVDSKTLDPNNPIVQCPNCNSQYTLQRQNAPPQGTQQPVRYRLSEQEVQAQKTYFKGLPRMELDRIAATMGMKPENYPSSDMLVEDMMKVQGTG